MWLIASEHDYSLSWRVLVFIGSWYSHNIDMYICMYTQFNYTHGQTVITVYYFVVFPRTQLNTGILVTIYYH